MIFAHKIRLNPTPKQEQYFRQACGVARFTYNWALAQYKQQLVIYKQTNNKEDKPNILELKKKFNSVKRELFPWAMDVTKCASAQSFSNLQKALSNFFSKRTKFPTKHKKGKRDSFYISNDQFSVLDKLVKIPKLGVVKLQEALKYTGKIMSGVISSQGDKWYIAINVDISNNPEQINDFYSKKLTNNPRLKDEIKVINFNQNKSEAIGIDLGIKIAIVTSDGEEIQAPKPLKRSLKKLKRTQRRLSKKVKGSNNRYKAKLMLSKLHARISNIRKDWLHKVSKYLCVNYKTIALEDLHIKGMIKNHKLAKAISDIGLGTFRQFIQYKANITCSIVRFIGRFQPSSKTCSSCGYVKETLSLSERTFKCEHCNLSIDRDYNASINILKMST